MLDSMGITYMYTEEIISIKYEYFCLSKEKDACTVLLCFCTVAKVKLKNVMFICFLFCLFLFFPILNLTFLQ